MRNRLIFAASMTIFAVLIFIALEMTLRVYYFGLAGLNPVKVNSFVNILSSGLVQPADNLEVWYELKPDRKTLFRGAPFRTNSHGLADDEYGYEKPPNTFRVAVLGSSWTMGAAVAVENTFHSVLEQEFNQESDSTRYEFLNFGVENYGLGEMMGVVNHKVLRYDPDMIMFVLTGFTPAIRWEPHKTPFVPPAHKNPGWSSYLVLKISSLLGIQSGASDGAMRELIRDEEWARYGNQIQQAFNELAVFSEANDIPVAAVWLRLAEKGVDNSRVSKLFTERAAEKNIASAVVDLEDYLLPGEPAYKLMIGRSEKHPNENTHKLIAAELREKLFPDGAPMRQTP